MALPKCSINFLMNGLQFSPLEEIFPAVMCSMLVMLLNPVLTSQGKLLIDSMVTVFSLEYPFSLSVKLAALSWFSLFTEATGSPGNNGES